MSKNNQIWLQTFEKNASSRKFPFVKMSQMESTSFDYSWDDKDIYMTLGHRVRTTNCQCLKSLFAGKAPGKKAQDLHLPCSCERKVRFSIRNSRSQGKFPFSHFSISSSQHIWQKFSTNKTNIDSIRLRLLTINFDVVEDEPRRRRAYLDKRRRKLKSLIRAGNSFISINFTWHSYVPSSIFSAASILSRQLFGYWKSTEYRGSPE